MIASFVRGLSTRDVEAALVDALGEQVAGSDSTLPDQLWVQPLSTTRLGARLTCRPPD